MCKSIVCDMWRVCVHVIISDQENVILAHADIQVSFVTNTYVAGENEGFAEVCLQLIGELDRSLNVTISTVDGTAVGEYNIHSYSL